MARAQKVAAVVAISDNEVIDWLSANPHMLGKWFRVSHGNLPHGLKPKDVRVVRLGAWWTDQQAWRAAALIAKWMRGRA